MQRVVAPVPPVANIIGNCDVKEFAASPSSVVQQIEHAAISKMQTYPSNLLLESACLTWCLRTSNYVTHTHLQIFDKCSVKKRLDVFYMFKMLKTALAVDKNAYENHGNVQTVI